MLARHTMQPSRLCNTCRSLLRSRPRQHLFRTSQTSIRFVATTPSPATTSSTTTAPPVQDAAAAGYTLPRPYTLPLNPAPPREATHPEKKPSDAATPSPPRPASTRARRPRKAVLTLTPDAVDRLRQIQSQDGKLIKISVVAKGCAGGAYRLDYLTPPAGKFDEVVEQDGVTVVVDSRSLMKVIGSVMDFRDDVLASRFVFENPNVVSTCGCEESFATKEDEERILGEGGKF